MSIFFEVSTSQTVRKGFLGLFSTRLSVCIIRAGRTVGRRLPPTIPALRRAATIKLKHVKRKKFGTNRWVVAASGSHALWCSYSVLLVVRNVRFCFAEADCSAEIPRVSNFRRRAFLVRRKFGRFALQLQLPRIGYTTMATTRVRDRPEKQFLSVSIRTFCSKQRAIAVPRKPLSHIAATQLRTQTAQRIYAFNFKSRSSPSNIAHISPVVLLHSEQANQAPTANAAGRMVPSWPIGFCWKTNVSKNHSKPRGKIHYV